MMTTQPPSTIGQRIKALRQARGLSLAALARLAECAPTDVWRWEEKGRVPTSEKVLLLGIALQVSTDYLLGRTDDPRTIEQFKADLIRYVSP